MKKLRLDSLTIESFATLTDTPRLVGTVAAREARGTQLYCPVSYGGTCWISCWETCPCTDGPDCA